MLVDVYAQQRIRELEAEVDALKSGRDREMQELKELLRTVTVQRNQIMRDAGVMDVIVPA